jgi:hypothetical protein
MAAVCKLSLCRRGIILDLEYHSVSPFVRIGSPPLPPPPPLDARGGYTRLHVRGRGQSIRTTEERKPGTLSTLWSLLYAVTLSFIFYFAVTVIIL